MRRHTRAVVPKVGGRKTWVGGEAKGSKRGSVGGDKVALRTVKKSPFVFKKNMNDKMS